MGITFNDFICHIASLQGILTLIVIANSLGSAGWIITVGYINHKFLINTERNKDDKNSKDQKHGKNNEDHDDGRIEPNKWMSRIRLVVFALAWNICFINTTVRGVITIDHCTVVPLFSCMFFKQQSKNLTTKCFEIIWLVFVS